MPEDPGRDQARGGQGEAAERAPDEVLRANGAGERRPQGSVRSGRAPRVEDGEVGVLLGRLDETRPKTGLAQDRLEVLREKVAHDVERAVAEPLRDRRGRQRRPELDPVDARRLLRVARVALENDPLRRVEGDPEGTGAQTAAPPSPGAGAATMAVRRIGQERGEDRERVRQPNHDLPLGRRAAMPSTLRRLPVEVLRDAADRDESRGHLVRETAGSSARARP